MSNLNSNNQIMMSDSLKSQVGDIDSQMMDQLNDQYVHVIADRTIGGHQEPLIGLLRSILLDVEPEIEFKVELFEAMKTIKSNDLGFLKFELHHGEDIVTIPGPFKVKAARIQDIEPKTQMCIIALHLRR
jgi:hypothetical protein